MIAINSTFMATAREKAIQGIMATTRTSLFPGMVLYRFANSRREDLHFTGPWWISVSPYEAILAWARQREQPLSLAARQSLAIDWEWSNVDVLIRVILGQKLEAWSGTPKTQCPKIDTPTRKGLISPSGVLLTPDRPRGWNAQYKGRRWEPDRDITQLYIPGLHEADPENPKRQIWENVFGMKNWTIHLQ